jgi:hypothetical protein
MMLTMFSSTDGGPVLDPASPLVQAAVGKAEKGDQGASGLGCWSRAEAGFALAMASLERAAYCRVLGAGPAGVYGQAGGGVPAEDPHDLFDVDGDVVQDH